MESDGSAIASIRQALVNGGDVWFVSGRIFGSARAAAAWESKNSREPAPGADRVKAVGIGAPVLAPENGG